MANYQSSLTGQQIEDVLTGVHSVSGVVMRVNDTTYRAADADDVNAVSLDAQTLTEEQKIQVRENIGADDFVPEAPKDGKQYARQDGEWTQAQGGAATSVKVNGVVYEPENGVADIGTVLREHQSLAAYRTAEAQTVIDSAQNEAIAAKADASALELTNKQLTLLAKLTKGQAWDTEAGATPAYIQTVPAGGKAVAVKSISGKTAVFNQLADFSGASQSTVRGITYTKNSDNSITVSGTASAYSSYIIAQNVAVTEGHRYYLFLSGEKAGNIQFGGATSSILNRVTGSSGILSGLSSAPVNIVIAVGADAVVDNATVRVGLFDLTLMFGAGNEPQTAAECKAILPNDYYPYNVGELFSANVVSVDSTDSNSVSIGTLAIPAEVRALEGYGQSNGSDYNYLDLEAKKFVEVGHYVNGVWTAHAQEIDVSAYITDDNILTVEGGGKLTFTQSGGINVPVPNGTVYAVQLSGAGGTSVMVNGETFAPVDGVANIGTVIRTHQDISDKADKPTVKSTMDAVATSNTIYNLGVQSAVSITMPTSGISIWDKIVVVFSSGITACTLTCDLTGFTFIPKANKTNKITFELIYKADTSVTGDVDKWMVSVEESE